MAMKTGREGMLGPHDEGIMRDLFFCRYLTTMQIAWLHYNGPRRASSRLSQLKRKGVLGSRVIYTKSPTAKSPGRREAVWHLTKDAFDMVAESLDAPPELRDKAVWTPKHLGPSKTRDHVKVNELYVAAKESLDYYAGPYPGWLWEHEKWATVEYEVANEHRVHRPDAHVSFFGSLFIIERQTKESRITSSEVREKVEAHALYASRFLGSEGRGGTHVVFAAEERRVAEAARRAGEDYGIFVFAGGVIPAARHLYQNVLRLMPDDRPIDRLFFEDVEGRETA
jgi:hypothetical protein